LGFSAAAAPIRLLILGGSLGARVFSDVVPEALAALPDALRARLLVTQQCRAEDLERVRAAYEQSGIAATLAPFFPNVAELLRDTHLAIARAGASTVAELATIGRPSILVPLPGAIDGHQRANAAALATPGGAILIDQATLTPAMLAHHLATHLANGETLARAAAAAATAGRPDAAARLADLVETAIARRASKEIPA
jgi:UDP-N-acetylglucosamine--N-acetylmuramyl-(pentapeptide) pyrophosphoryl-undecaprenol N-acetylglucosamine transferase